MNPKKSKKIKSKKANNGVNKLFHKKGTDVLIEDMHSTVSFMAEQMGGINNKFDNMELQMGGIHNKLGDIDIQLVNIHSKLDEHTKILNKHSEILDDHTQELQTIND